jgi:hypothetical protein
MSNRKTVVAACAVVLSLAGCANQTGPAQTTTPPPLPGSPAAVSSSVPPPLQDGPLTPTGTKLAFGAAARVRYETKSQGKERTKIGVVPVSVKQGSVDDFRNVKLPQDVLSKDFFYVTVSFTNLGPLPLDPRAIMVQIKPYDTAGTKMNYLTIVGSFSPCAQDTDEMAVGATHTSCAVYVAPKGQDVGKVVFGYNDYTSTPSSQIEITWPSK